VTADGSSVSPRHQRFIHLYRWRRASPAAPWPRPQRRLGSSLFAQTIIRPITSALQTTFNKVAQIGYGNGESNGEATGWVKAMNFGRQTQQLGNLGSDSGQRVPAPKDVRGTSIMPSRAPNTRPMNAGTARYGNGKSSTAAMGKATSKI
jgi:hypothetical protein